jgi:hypothetical protein
MPDLEDEIDVLQELDRIRVRSAELRDWGYACLGHWVTAKRKNEAVNEHSPLIVRVLYQRKQPAAVESWMTAKIKELERLTLEKLAGGDYHLVQTALVAQALTAAPSSAFSPHSPEWSAGGASMGRGGLVSAFMTGECVRALLGFARAQTNTAKLLRVLKKIRRRSQHSVRLAPLEWRKAEEERLSWSIYTTVRLASRNLAVRVSIEDLEDARKFITGAPASLLRDIREAKKVFSQSARAIERYRILEGRRAVKSKGLQKEFERSHFGHFIGLEAVRHAEANAERALSILLGGRLSSFDDWERLAGAFDDAAAEVRGLLRPALGFLSRVMDREVVAALSGQQWDASELACAACAYGECHERWDEERLVTAVNELGKAVTQDGRFVPWRPVHLDASERSSYLYGGSLLRVFAQLLENVGGAAVRTELVARLVDFFEGTVVSTNEDAAELGGWRSEWGRRSGAGLTASAVQALEDLNTMFDRRINDMVLRHFSVKRPDSRRSELKLDDAFYADYGLRLAPDEVRPDQSVSIVLERMRAHVAGIRVPQRRPTKGTQKRKSPIDSEETLCSVVLHGPPGTGKTTLLEALAASCEVPLIELTPSDIVIRGEDSIERRTRAVFKALSLLTHVVIMLDEFDPVLWRRDPDDTSPRSVFSFLTPGMLPKLKELHRQARRRRVCYGLITNLVGGLEPAAIREGRFDCRLGVYPPDPLSRAGRFLSELRAYKGRPDLAPGEQKRALQVIVRTAGASMPVLTRSGWFVKPEGPRPRTPFHYVLEDGPEPQWPKTEAEDWVNGNGTVAELENRQWLWIKEWDRRTARRKALAGGVGKPPKSAPAAVYKDATRSRG